MGWCFACYRRRARAAPCFSSLVLVFRVQTSIHHLASDFCLIATVPAARFQQRQIAHYPLPRTRTPFGGLDFDSFDHVRLKANVRSYPKPVDCFLNDPSSATAVVNPLAATGQGLGIAHRITSSGSYTTSTVSESRVSGNLEDWQIVPLHENAERGSQSSQRVLGPAEWLWLQR